MERRLIPVILLSGAISAVVASESLGDICDVDGDNELINGDPDPPSAPAAADTHVVRSRGVHWTIGAEGQMRARAAA